MKPSIVNRIKSNWTLKRLGKVAMTVAFTLVIAIFLLAMLGTVVRAAGLVDDTVNVANEYSRYPLENYQLDFYVDNSWGWLPWNWSGTGLENRSCMDYMPLPILFGQSVCMFPMQQVTWYRKVYSFHFISATADSIGKNMQTFSWCECKRIFNRGFLCWIPLTLDFGSWGLCCLYGTDKERNHKGNSCHYEFCAGVYPIGFLYCLRSRLH